MIDKKNFKMSKLALLVLSTLTLICETATSVRAQGSDNKIKVSTSHRCSATDSHNGMRAMFAFLRENIEYPSKAIEAKMQGDVTVGFTVVCIEIACLGSHPMNVIDSNRKCRRGDKLNFSFSYLC